MDSVTFWRGHRWWVTEPGLIPGPPASPSCADCAGRNITLWSTGLIIISRARETIPQYSKRVFRFWNECALKWVWAIQPRGQNGRRRVALQRWVWHLRRPSWWPPHIQKSIKSMCLSLFNPNELSEAKEGEFVFHGGFKILTQKILLVSIDPALFCKGCGVAWKGSCQWINRDINKN